MIDDYTLELILQGRTRFRHKSRPSRALRNTEENGFHCRNCHAFVYDEPLFSGVRNRNHCPYCLWSRHLDLYQPGDRMAACKASMQPIGLTMKRSLDKYGLEKSGELMLIHRCMECGCLSINRIAADDDPLVLLETFHILDRLDSTCHESLQSAGIRPLQEDELHLVQSQLFGQQVSFSGCVV